MKTLTIAALVAALLASSPALAKLVTVDDPDVPNCTMVGPNAPDCETIANTESIYTGTKYSPRP